MVSGRILDASGNPVSGVKVRASSRAGLCAAATSNAKGIYALVLPAGEYRITAGAEGEYSRRVLTVVATKGIRAPQTTLVVNRSGLLAIDREPVTVKDYIAANSADGALYSANSLTVSGVFKPESDRHWGCTLASGATLDLTGWVGPWNATSASGRAVIFPTTAGATVNVNLAGRADFTLLPKDDDGNRILATWATMPENTKFVLDSATSRTAWKLVKTEDGLRLKCVGFKAIVR